MTPEEIVEANLRAWRALSPEVRARFRAGHGTAITLTDHHLDEDGTGALGVTTRHRTGHLWIPREWREDDIDNNEQEQS